MMRLVFLGPPGSGKGTQAKILAQKRSLRHISTGDVLREAVRKGTSLGQEAKSHMDEGELVPDSVILGMIKELLQENGQGFILDGFPRTAAQAEGLQRILADLGLQLDAAINLAVPDEEVMKRLTGRYYCGSCGADYNVNSKPPVRLGFCDKCGGKLTQREDDRVEVIANRLKVYREKTKPVEDYYRVQSLLEEIDGAQSFEDVSAAILKVVN